MIGVDVKMNKIIIIGNGFDLAHGLSTSYSDFINKCFEDNPNFGNNWKSPLLKEIREMKKDKNWVDIESLYFRLIFKLLDFSNESQVNLQFIKNLNHDFDILRTTLLDYLKKEQNDKNIIPSQKYIDLFLNGFNKSKDELTIVNFNYTDTADRYLQNLTKQIGFTNKSNIRCINIHGKIDSITEEPIFGIGDEFNSEYNKIKDFEDISDILKFSKSFWYQRNNNYQKLSNILESYKFKKRGHIIYPQKFSVEIFGHSCGLSDRTLLKNIFSNISMQNITLYHYPDKESYIEQTYNIWRHFDNSHQFRMKLKPYSELYLMPQIK